MKLRFILVIFIATRNFGLQCVADGPLNCEGMALPRLSAPCPGSAERDA
jgi:hypothetical protein